ncbi:MAG: CPBP family intramembrane metalloprotease [Ardenticatenaceae bacterium]|nr:CPBP family intramembrane metalloprotease [Ardenticatenaceae bacterium]
MENGEAVQTVSIFVGIAFGLSIILSIATGATGGAKSKMTRFALIAFFFPAIAVLIMTFGFDAPIDDAGWGRFPFTWLLVALFIFPLAIHLVALPVQAAINNNSLPWQKWLTPDEAGFYQTPKGNTLTRPGLVSSILQNALIGVVLVSFFAFFEEIGWRAWMLPRLMDSFDLRTAVFISALIWSLWHVPFVFGGIQQIEGVPTRVMLILYPLGLVGAGIVLGWLWLNSRSIWIVTLAHGALNNWGQFAFKYMEDSPPKETGFHSNVVLLTAVNLTLVALGLIILFRI